MENVKIKLENEYFLSTSKVKKSVRGRFGFEESEVTSVDNKVYAVGYNGEAVLLSKNDIIELAKIIHDLEDKNTFSAIPL